MQRLALAVEGEVDAAFLTRWASEQRFWRAWVQRLHPEPFETFAREWEAASEYFTELSEVAASPGAYNGPTVPAAFMQALERETTAVPGLAWRVEGVLQRIDLVSGRYPNENELYRRAGELLIATRNAARNALYRQLTGALFHLD